MIFTSTLGTIGPTDPGKLPSLKVLTAITGEVSVRPYPSITETLSVSSTFLSKAWGRAEPPEMQYFREETS